jgi:glycosyltransferase involved in cell wall biosynthesis
MKRKKVIFVVQNMSAGGAERIISLLLQNLDPSFEPILVMFKESFNFAIPADVRIICLHKRRLLAIPGLIWQLKRIYETEKPDAVLSVVEWVDLVALLAKIISRVKPRLIVNIVNHTSINLHRSLDTRLEKLVLSQLYKSADIAICMSRGIADDLVKTFHFQPDQIRIIPGLIDIDEINLQARVAVDHPYFQAGHIPIVVAVGRLHRQKGYPYLLRAFAAVNTRLPCHLIILGNGKEHDSLVDLARQLGIEDRVAFLGFQPNPFKYLARSDLFVLSSLWEGFALVITEAMACGIPVVSTRCPSGPDEIITDGVDGLLVPVADESALAGAMLRVLTDAALKTRLSRDGLKRADDFNAGEIVKQYAALF